MATPSARPAGMSIALIPQPRSRRQLRPARRARSGAPARPSHSGALTTANQAAGTRWSSSGAACPTWRTVRPSSLPILAGTDSSQPVAETTRPARTLAARTPPMNPTIARTTRCVGAMAPSWRTSTSPRPGPPNGGPEVPSPSAAGFGRRDAGRDRDWPGCYRNADHQARPAAGRSRTTGWCQRADHSRDGRNDDSWRRTYRSHTHVARTEGIAPPVLPLHAVTRLPLHHGVEPSSPSSASASRPRRRPRAQRSEPQRPRTLSLCGLDRPRVVDRGARCHDVHPR